MEYAYEGFVDRSGRKRALCDTDSGPPDVYLADLDLGWNDEEGNLPVLEQEYGLTGEPGVPLPDKFLDILEATTEEILHNQDWRSFRKAIWQAIKSVEIVNIVCVGIGTIFDATSRRAMSTFIEELAFTLAVRQLLRQESMQRCGYTECIHIIFQDPRLCDPDVELLEAVGGLVLEGRFGQNHAQKLVDVKTMLIGLSIPHHVAWQVALRNTNPAIWIGNCPIRSADRVMADAYVDRDIEEMDFVEKASIKLSRFYDKRSFQGFGKSVWEYRKIWWRKQGRSLPREMHA